MLQESQSSHERFGAVFSPNTHGLVLSVTPNSPASNLGLKSGDVIVNVNNLSLEKSNVNALIEKHYLDNNHTISIKVSRDNRSQYLSGKLSTLVTPAWALTVDNINQVKPIVSDTNVEEYGEQCGRIIVGKYMPQEEVTLHRAKTVFIREIDGVKQKVSSGGHISNAYFDAEKTRFKLSVGEHKIVVAPRYSNNTNHIKTRDGKDTEFLMTIAADTSYYLVYDTRKDSPYSKTNTPVIWQTKSQNCEF